MSDNVPNLHPRTRANFFSILFFTYTLETFTRGQNYDWNDKNIYNPPDFLRSKTLGEKINTLWLRHQENYQTTGCKPDIKIILAKMFWTDLLKDSCLLILSLVPRVIQPLLFGNFLSYFSRNCKIGKYEAYWYASSFLIVTAIGIVSSVHYKMSSSITALKIRTACATLLHKKILRMTTSVLQDGNKETILNLISNDLTRVDHTFSYINFIWGSPLFVLSIVYLLHYDVGIPGLIGMLWYVFYMFVQSHFAKLTGSYRNKVAKESDKRIKLINEILVGYKTIKMNAWEKPFSQTVECARKSELNVLKTVTYLKTISHSLLSFANIMAVFLGVLSMIIMRVKITPAEVFKLLVYYNSFNYVITLMFPFSITKATEINQVLKRVTAVMTEEEIVENQKQFRDYENFKIIMRKVNTKRDKKKQKIKEEGELSLLKSKDFRTVLENINMLLMKRTFLGVTGPVGCGKSSLLHTILGETSTSGFLFMNGSVAYVSQDPWIFAGTIRDNILFYHSFDEERYKDVLRVCGLEKDLRSFSSHDMTIIGDRGATLSGGQKSRINLARAVYRDVDIYLLDDPFASVDANMSKYLLNECFNGFLMEKCRILVTHSIHYLDKCDHIIILNA